MSQAAPVSAPIDSVARATRRNVGDAAVVAVSLLTSMLVSLLVLMVPLMVLLVWFMRQESSGCSD